MPQSAARQPAPSVTRWMRTGRAVPKGKAKDELLSRMLVIAVNRLATMITMRAPEIGADAALVPASVGGANGLGRLRRLVGLVDDIGGLDRREAVRADRAPQPEIGAVAAGGEIEPVHPGEIDAHPCLLRRRRGRIHAGEEEEGEGAERQRGAAASGDAHPPVRSRLRLFRGDG